MIETTMKVVAGPFQQTDGVWQGPPGTTGTIDLRDSESQRNVGLFVVPDGFSDGGYMTLGNAPDAAVPRPDRQSFAAMLGLPSVPTADRLMPMIEQVMTEHADPGAAGGRNPLMPTHRSRLELHLGPWSTSRTWRGASEGRAWQHVRAVIRANYARHKAVDPVTASKYAVAMARKLKVAFHDIADPGDVPARPTTTISDDFNRGNQAGLGTSAEGWSWVNDANTSISSNRASLDGGGSAGRANTNLSTDDHYAEIVAVNLTGINKSVAAMARRESSATVTGYVYRREGINDHISKVENGGETVLVSEANVIVAGDTLQTRVSGSGIQGLRNSNVRLAVTDTAISGNLQTGLFAAQGGVLADNFSAADFIAPSTLLIRHHEGLYVGSQS